MQRKNLAIISNEKTFFNKFNHFCDNLDLKSIPEGLNSYFNIELFTRNSKKNRFSHKINIKNICATDNIFSYLLNIIKKRKNINFYLIVSLTPYTFLACILLFFLGKKTFLYFRSDGYEEYKCYSKYFGPIIYHFMFTISCTISNIIACRQHILRGKNGKVVSPSQLNKNWFLDRKLSEHKDIKLLYVGRIRPEKGVISLIKILKKMDLNYKLSIINPEKNYINHLQDEKIKILNFKNENDSIINIYDQHNIFILPSFTEGHPQVLDEALARLKPVIIFPEISHVIGHRKGVFISERNTNSLLKKINFIMDKYKIIQEDIKKNNLPVKKKFLEDITNIILEG